LASYIKFQYYPTHSKDLGGPDRVPRKGEDDRRTFYFEADFE